MQLLCPACRPHPFLLLPFLPSRLPSTALATSEPLSPSSGGNRGFTLPRHTLLGGLENRRAAGGKGHLSPKLEPGEASPPLHAHAPSHKETPSEALVLATLDVMGSPSQGGLAGHPGVWSRSP